MANTNLGMTNPTPGDPAVKNQWGTIENEGRTIIDQAVSGITTINVAGSSNIVVTTNPGSTAQDPATHFVLTGALTGNIDVLWPNGKTRKFTVFNDTSGAHTLAIGANNGSGSPAGTTVTVAQGDTVEVVSDGTNVTKTGISAVPQDLAIGPGSSVAKDVAIFSGTDGLTLEDGGSFAIIPFATAGGTGNAITATFTPATPTLGSGENGWVWRVRASAANTGATTFAPDGQGPYSVKKNGSAALVGGEIPAAGAEIFLSYNYNGGSPYVEILNPTPIAAASPSNPTTTVLTSGSGASYSTPAGVAWLFIRMIGAGGGGGGSTGGTNGGAGGDTIFNGIHAAGGAGGDGGGNSAAIGAAGGTGGTGTASFRSPGNGSDYYLAITAGGKGGGSALGGGAASPGPANSNGVSAVANSGGGGSGASWSNDGGGGGGGGEYVEILITSPAASYTYTVGAGGTGGTGNGVGGTGGSGVIIIEEHYAP